MTEPEPVHYFSYRVNRGRRGCSSYGACGKEGRMAYEIPLVTCPECKEVVGAIRAELKKETG